MGVSLRPSDAISGGLLDDVDVEITKALYEMYDYAGKSDPAPALVLTLQTEGGDEYTEALSVGAAKDWAPSDDGTELIRVGDAKFLRDSCKAIKFLTSAVNAGFPEDKLQDGNPTVLVGLGFHAMRTTVEYKGLEKKIDPTSGQARDFQVLEVQEILYLPGEKKKGKGAPAAAGGEKKKAAPKKAAPKEEGSAPSGGDDEVDEAATAALLELLSESDDGTIEAKMIPQKIFRKLADVKNKNKVLQRSYSDDFLGGDDRPWSYEDGVVTLG